MAFVCEGHEAMEKTRDKPLKLHNPWGYTSLSMEGMKEPTQDKVCLYFSMFLNSLWTLIGQTLSVSLFFLHFMVSVSHTPTVLSVSSVAPSAKSNRWDDSSLAYCVLSMRWRQNTRLVYYDWYGALQPGHTASLLISHQPGLMRWPVPLVIRHTDFLLF